MAVPRTTQRILIPAMLTHGDTAMTLLDTGSDVSVISAALVRRKRLTLMPLTSDDPELRTADGRTLHCIGAVWLHYKLGTQRFADRILVIEGLQFELIWGLDFIKSRVKSIDVQEQTLVWLPKSVMESNKEMSKQAAVAAIMKPGSKVVQAGWDDFKLMMAMPSVTRPATALKSCLVFQPMYEAPTTLWRGVRVGAELPVTDWEAITAMIDEYSAIFAQKKEDFGSANFKPLIFDVLTERPIRLRPYRLSQKELEWCLDTVKMWLAAGRIIKSDSDWAFPAFPVEKPGEDVDNPDWRLVVDFHQLCKHVPMDNFPTPLARDIFDRLAGTKHFSKIDFQSAYLQIKVDESCQKYLSFVVGGEQYQFVYVPFGLNVAGGKLQRELQRLFAGIPGVFGYADDWFIASVSIEDHRRSLKMVFEKIQECGMLIKPGKCVFAVDHIQFLGRMISAAGVSLLPTDVETVQGWPVPENAKEMSRFFGLGEWCSEFVPEYAIHARQLRIDVVGDEGWQWTSSAAKTFMLFKKSVFKRYDTKFSEFFRTFHFGL